VLRAGAIAAALAVACAGCGGGKETTTEAQTTGGTTRPPGCPYLVARLQRATLAIRSSAELVARSKNKTQLVKRIGIEQQQLERSAALVATGPTPASLVPATKRLAAALHALSVDFSKAKKPAAAGNYPAAARLMADRTLQLRIVRESQAIARGCT
jgi:hypothetical protein